MPLPVGMVEAGVRPADSGRDGGCGLTGGSAGQPADRRTGLAHLPADGTGAEAWAGEPGAGPGGLPWPAGRPVRSAVALAYPPVRTAMVDRRVRYVHRIDTGAHPICQTRPCGSSLDRTAIPIAMDWPHPAHVTGCGFNTGS
jgi:hypothetical protein